MAGIKAKVEMVIASIDDVGSLTKITKVADEYTEYSGDNTHRYVKTSNGIHFDVMKLTIDDKVIFEYEITITENDTRKDWVEIKTKLAEIELKLQCGLMEKEDYEIEKAKLYKELSKYLEVTNHKVDWKLIK